MDIAQICAAACRQGASDIHITVESPPAARVHGELVRMPLPSLSASETDRLLGSFCPPDRLQRFRATGQVDFSYSIPGTGRFRVNAFRQRGSTAMTIRILRGEVPRLSDLGLPPVVYEFAALRNGLVLVAGATGSGKSSTLAGIVAEISSTRPYHIITLEDPVEFLHKHGKGLVNQREIGSDTPSFADGVRAALREDPDVIVIGELRDHETAATALSAAETGHLVLATVHAPRAPGAVNRLTDLFPSEYQRQVRAQISEVLEGIIAQQLLPRASGAGRAAACEVLAATQEVRGIIRSGEIHRLQSVIARRAAGMVTMEQSLDALCAAGAISPEVMRARS
ncbi:MAG TPA: PilT/PilU family type 4a pilus ATPase [Firmicutes bacterium]|jgi:twitching motility protein PilT|nr:PilT/PilU family type 4a pilus ATPase [Candidatus Fermentithermobacillaceae bacterium]